MARFATNTSPRPHTSNFVSKSLSSSDLNILYWNARSINAHKEELEVILKGVDIFVCVESWLKPDIKFNIRGFNVFRKDRENMRGGGILFLVRKKYAYKEITIPNAIHDTVELSGININNISPPLNIFTCYRTPGHNLNQNQWDEIISSVQSLPKDCILVGDFNAHHTIWNCDHNCTNGERLYNTIDDSDLFLHNLDTYTHIDLHRNKKSNIDLIMSSSRIADKLNVTVHDETWGSDHFPIFVNINIVKHVYHKKSFRIYSVKTNWTKATNLLEEKFDTFYSAEYENASAANKYKIFTDVIKNCIIESTPVKRTVPLEGHRNPVAWWDAECDQLIRQRKGFYNKWNETNSQDHLINYKRTIALVKKTFKEKKKSNFKGFAKEINVRKNTSYTWRKCKIFKNKWIKATPISLTEHLQSKSMLNDTLDKISPAWVPSDPHYLPKCDKNDFFDAQYDFREFNIALEGKNAKSTPGPDGLDYYILQYLPLKYKLILLDIFNQMYSSNEFPESWKQSYLHFIEKPDGLNYRPITLSSCVCKLFETMIKNRLLWWCEHHNLLPQSQTGFRKGQSCSDNLSNLALYVEEGFRNNKDTLAAFLDVQGAFDNVVCEILLDILASIGCPQNLIHFIKSLTYDRMVTTDLTNNLPRNISKGVPQGGVLSPLFYTLYVSKITTNLPKRVAVSQFADDITIYTKTSPIKNAVSAIEKTIVIIRNNLKTLGLELSPKKTVVIHFNKNKVAPGDTTIKIDDTTIKSSESTKFLGIIFDYRMTFEHHINYIIKKCAKAMNILKFLCGTWWGSDPDTLLILYKSFVRPHIDYGSFIYFPTRKNLIQKIEKIQLTAVRIALGYRRTTPTNIILEESKLPSIENRARFLGQLYVLKSLSNTNIISNRSIHQFYKKSKKQKRKRKRLLQRVIEEVVELTANKLLTEQQFHLYMYQYGNIISNIPVNIDLGNTVKRAQNPNNEFLKLINSQNAIKIYTDGSKSKYANSVGCSCVCDELNVTVNRSFPRETSIFTAECIALNEAVDIAINNSNNNFMIITDSLSALNSINSSKVSPKTNPYILSLKDIYHQFYNKSKCKLEFIWIPSHIGVTGNDKADSSAKIASNSDAELEARIPPTDFRHNYKLSASAQTKEQNLNQGMKKGVEYFQTHVTNSNKPWFHKKNLSRKDTVTINRCRANHYNLAASLSRVKLIDSPKCDCSFETQDLNHVIWNCPLYENQREKLTNELKKCKKYSPYSINPFLAECDITALKLICIFFEKCDLRI